MQEESFQEKKRLLRSKKRRPESEEGRRFVPEAVLEKKTAEDQAPTLHPKPSG